VLELRDRRITEVMIIQCPNCHSKFRFSGMIRAGHLQMRCSVCHHVFEHSIEPEAILDREFEMLLSSRAAPEPAPEPEAPLGGDTRRSSRHRARSLLPKKFRPKSRPQLKPSYGDRSLLGSASKEELEVEGQFPKSRGKKKPPEGRRPRHMPARVCHGFAVAFKDKLLFSRNHAGAAPGPGGKGPLFVIDEGTLSHEILAHEQEGNVLVIKAV
jgi:predicted Zn finger-like uncharacterized protein